jgi:hypothetical protein
VPLFSFRRSASPSQARSHPQSPGVRFFDDVALSFSALRVRTREDRLPRKHLSLQSTAAAESLRVCAEVVELADTPSMVVGWLILSNFLITALLSLHTNHLHGSAGK